MGKVEKSIEYLKKYLDEVSNKESDIQHARVCSCLAEIYNAMVISLVIFKKLKLRLKFFC